METHFLPPEKETFEKVLEQHTKIKDEINNSFFLNAAPVIYLILNSKRQVVWANNTVFESFQFSDISNALGKRVGELFLCLHAFETEGGCGTTEFCTTCGVANSINQGLNGIINFQECRIVQTNSSDALDLKVTSTPFKINGENYTIFTVTDISNENRRKALERIFFHDIANTVGNLSGYLSLLDPSNTEEFNSDKEILISLSHDLQDEINAQKILLDAENNELTVNLSVVNSIVLLYDKVQKYLRYYLTTDKILTLSPDSVDIDFQTDTILLKRIVGNMMKNAIEASNPDNTITVGCNVINKNIEFWVHNESYMPREIQLQLFHRSFSSKGKGRGLGSYSMKLLAERYLGGKVSFTSSEKEGTKFKISLPLGI